MKLALIGSGRIILDALYALKAVPSVEVKAIYVREHSYEKGLLIAKEFGIEPDEVYTDYELLLDKADIDAVYIGLINSAHYSYSKTALCHHKHVIVEKPFTATGDEAVELINLARKNSIFIFEAITVLHSQVFSKMKQCLELLGTIRMIRGNYSQYSSAYDRYLQGEVPHAFDIEHLGGALRDINIYNIHYTAALFGLPKEAHYYSNKGFNGIDTSGVLILDYGDFKAVCMGAKDSDSDCHFVVQGEKGFMSIDGKPNVAANLRTKIVKDSKGELKRDAAGAVLREYQEDNFIPQKVHHRMCDEFRNFASVIDSHDSKKAEYYMQETINVMKIIDMVCIE